MHPVDEADETTIDPFSTSLPGPELVPNYLVSKFAAQYRVVVEVLLAAQDSSLTGMSFDEITSAVRTRLLRDFGEDATTQLLTDARYHLDARLDQLEKWQVLTRWQEPARTGEDFLRRRDRYQLTPLAARLHTFWLEVREGADNESGEFTLAPRAIHERLVAFAEALADRRFVAAASEFQQVAAIHQTMARAAQGWQRTLAHALSGGPDQAKQDLLWRTLQAYVGMWGEQVDTYSPRISDLIVNLRNLLGPAEWAAIVRTALVADAGEDLVQKQAHRWTKTWDALVTWFSGPDGQARRLRRQLRDLVAPWARNMHILVDTGGAVTRRGELLCLAEAIEQAPSEDDAWRIWNTAVGVTEAGVSHYAPATYHAGEAALIVMAGRAVSGSMSPRGLAAWAHQAFGHDRLRLATLLSELDDAYDLVEYSDSTTDNVDGQVMAEAHRLVGGVRRYWYLGPPELRHAVPWGAGSPIDAEHTLIAWLHRHDPQERGEPFTFVVDLGGRLRLAPRRSEHVACAGGADVLAAGEIRFEIAHGHSRVVEVSNQSTGYCPDVTSWAAVEAVYKSSLNR